MAGRPRHHLCQFISQKPPLIDNWTNSEFEHFVKDLEDLVNEYLYPRKSRCVCADHLHEHSLGIQPGSSDWLRAEEIWERVIELEEAFWPGGEAEIAAMLS